MADGDEVVSTLTPPEIKEFLTANPPVKPEGYDDMAADNIQKTGYDASKTSWDTSLVEIQVIIDA
jgi:hypothetical protein